MHFKPEIAQRRPASRQAAATSSRSGPLPQASQSTRPPSATAHIATVTQHEPLRRFASTPDLASTRTIPIPQTVTNQPVSTRKPPTLHSAAVREPITTEANHVGNEQAASYRLPHQLDTPDSRPCSAANAATLRLLASLPGQAEWLASRPNTAASAASVHSRTSLSFSRAPAAGGMLRKPTKGGIPRPSHSDSAGGAATRGRATIDNNDVTGMMSVRSAAAAFGQKSSATDTSCSTAAEEVVRDHCVAGDAFREPSERTHPVHEGFERPSTTQGASKTAGSHMIEDPLGPVTWKSKRLLHSLAKEDEHRADANVWRRDAISERIPDVEHPPWHVPDEDLMRLARDGPAGQRSGKGRRCENFGSPHEGVIQMAQRRHLAEAQADKQRQRHLDKVRQLRQLFSFPLTLVHVTAFTPAR